MVPLATLAGVTLLGLIGLKGFLAWIDLKHAELERREPSGVAGRIELADLRERVRQLEAIAAGVEL